VGTYDVVSVRRASEMTNLLSNTRVSRIHREDGAEWNSSSDTGKEKGGDKLEEGRHCEMFDV
jgi:hypothetical protein